MDRRQRPAGALRGVAYVVVLGVLVLLTALVVAALMSRAMT